MTTYPGDCSVSITITPTPGAVGTFATGASVSLLISPRARGAQFVTYTDEQGQLQPVYLAEWYKGRVYEVTGRQVKYSRRFFVHGTYETTDCVDLGPQVGDYDDVIPTMIVQSRKLTWYAQGGGESDMVAIDVDYAEPDTPQNEGGDSEGTYSLEFASESEHIDLTLANQTVYGKQPLAGQERLINYDPKDGVQGVDIDAPIVEYTELHNLTDAQFTTEYRTTLRDCIKKTNSAVWRGLEIGSVLFDGASTTKRNNIWYLTFRFRIRRGLVDKEFTITNEAGASETVKVTKKGWEYLWVQSFQHPNAAGDKVFIAPGAIYVGQVYESVDFAVLDIGTGPLALGFL